MKKLLIALIAFAFTLVQISFAQYGGGGGGSTYNPGSSV